MAIKISDIIALSGGAVILILAFVTIVLAVKAQNRIKETNMIIDTGGYEEEDLKKVKI